MRYCLLLLAAVLSSTADSRMPPAAVFAAVGVTADEAAAIDAGRPVAKVLPWGDPSEVYVFGAVHVQGSREIYLNAARDVRGLSGTPGYLGVGELSSEVTPADLRGLTFEPDDVKALKSCREGACDVQLPTASIQAFHDAVDFARPDAGDQVSALAQSMFVRLVRSYQQGGHDTLGEYRDKQHPARVADQFVRMLDRASVLPDVLPDLRAYLLDYPRARLANADSFFFWEKVDFGLKPTVRVNHGLVYRGRTEGREVGVVAIKQLYATHYFHTALDVTVCVDDAGDAGRGFYLLTIKGSQQEGLTGVKGAILRKIVVDRTRRSLETALAAIKRTVERASP